MWLKNARSLKRITIKQLAEMVGKSQVYLKKIEAGERDLPPDLADEIYSALGFTPQDIPFNTKEMLEEVKSISNEVRLGYAVVDGIIYFNSLAPLSDTDSVVVDKKFATLLLESQLTLFG